jgi:Type VI secretion system/phage-baseplate injector OB domain
MGNLFKQMSKNSESVVDRTERWATGLTGIVAENNDPANQHRIKVVIPSLVENETYDEWVRSFASCFGDGFGTCFIPKIGTEVVLFGTLGEKFNLFYASVFNEDYRISNQLSKDIPGIHSPKDLYFIAEQVAKILAENILIKAEQKTDILGNDIDIVAQDQVKTDAATVKSTASGTNEISGGNLQIHGGNVTVNSDGSITISGQNISITASGNMTLQGRLVRKLAPPI